MRNVDREKEKNMRNSQFKKFDLNFQSKDTFPKKKKKTALSIVFLFLFSFSAQQYRVKTKTFWGRRKK